jgi:hypothetical protein
MTLLKYCLTEHYVWNLDRVLQMSQHSIGRYAQN